MPWQATVYISSRFYFFLFPFYFILFFSVCDRLEEGGGILLSPVERQQLRVSVDRSFTPFPLSHGTHTTWSALMVTTLPFLRRPAQGGKLFQISLSTLQDSKNQRHEKRAGEKKIPKAHRLDGTTTPSKTHSTSFGGSNKTGMNQSRPLLGGGGKIEITKATDTADYLKERRKKKQRHGNQKGDVSPSMTMIINIT